MKEKNGFTLIELIAVLVILSIIVSIIWVVVGNIISKSKYKAYERSIDGYGHAIEVAAYQYYLDTGKMANNISDLKINYRGYDVDCNIKSLYKNQVYLSECSIDGVEIRSKNTSDGWYHYGTAKYEYLVGDIVTYNYEKYYVLRNSLASDQYVTLLKKNLLTGSELRDICSSVSLNCSSSSYQSIIYNEYNDTISLIPNLNYDDSKIKQVLDLWGNINFNNNELETDKYGYKIRLLNYDDLEYVGYDKDLKSKNVSAGETTILVNDDVPSWLYDVNNNNYWTMCQNEDATRIFYISSMSHGNISTAQIQNNNYIRPVINLKKSVIKEGL